MKIELLAADATEFEQFGIVPQAAFARGSAALGKRMLHGRLRETAETEAGLREIVDLFAEKSADARAIRFAFATAAPAYERMRAEYEQLGWESIELRRVRAPELQRRLVAMRAREQTLERQLAERGIEPSVIGPLIRPEEAVDPLLGGWDVSPPRLTPPSAPPPGIVRRLLRRPRGR